jgi:magnesium transporter
VEFDFAARTERSIALAEAKPAIVAGRFVWLDLLASDPQHAREILREFGLIADDVITDALKGEAATRLARYDDYIHVVMSGCRQRGTKFDLERVDVVIAERFLATIHLTPVLFLDSVRRDYRSDFLRFAKSPSFMVYELWDHLLENYLAVQRDMEERVEEVQLELAAEKVDDTVFAHISALGADLLHLRKVLLPARSVLTDLSTRKSIFVSEATQPFLHNMVGTLEHVLQDLLVDRDILSESLNLYMSMVSHRTNQVMKRLTVVSMVFLPLTFLCGVYGMNFEVLPELQWQYGYLLFWIVAVLIVAALLALMRRAKIL